MNIYKNIFQKKRGLDHKNDRLVFLLNNWAQKPSTDTHNLVMKEIVGGNSYLLLPSVNDGTIPDHWTISHANTILKLRTVEVRDGIKTLWAFSDEDALSKWAQNKMTYIALNTQSVLTICDNEKIDQIVINIDSPNAFLVKRQ